MNYKVVCYMRVDIDEEDEEFYESKEEAESVQRHFEFLQPENIYVVEEVEESIDSKEY